MKVRIISDGESYRAQRSWLGVIWRDLFYEGIGLLDWPEEYSTEDEARRAIQRYKNPKVWTLISK